MAILYGQMQYQKKMENVKKAFEILPGAFGSHEAMEATTCCAIAFSS